MELRFLEDGTVQIDEARITYKNFRGEKGPMNRDGKRKFSVIIPTPEQAEMLKRDVNEHGVAWNVKIKPPADGYDTPFMYLEVTVNFNQYGPAVWLVSADGVKQPLSPERVGILDKMAIEKVNMDIYPYDNFTSGNHYRTAYLRCIEVYQRANRFDRFAPEDDYNEE